MKTGDQVAWIFKNRDYHWVHEWVWVISVGDGVVAVYRSLSRNQLLDEIDSVEFVDPSDLVVDDGEGNVFREIDRRNN